jgi:hypothetical protein
MLSVGLYAKCSDTLNAPVWSRSDLLAFADVLNVVCIALAYARAFARDAIAPNNRSGQPARSAINEQPPTIHEPQAMSNELLSTNHPSFALFSEKHDNNALLI